MTVSIFDIAEVPLYNGDVERPPEAEARQWGQRKLEALKSLVRELVIVDSEI